MLLRILRRLLSLRVLPARGAGPLSRDHLEHPPRVRKGSGPDEGPWLGHRGPRARPLAGRPEEFAPRGRELQPGRAWDNHFAAFGSQDVGKILLDYCEQSKIVVYNWHDDTETVYNGMAGAKRCFNGYLSS